MRFSKKTLCDVLSKMLNKPIKRAEYEKTKLQGGTVGNVWFISGTADGQPFKLVLKVQKKWERYGDPLSWRREYDFYMSNFSAVFNDSLKWPNCYRVEMLDENKYALWLEYIDGVSGIDLTNDMMEQAALELGRLQGRLYALNPEKLREFSNLSEKSFMKNYYLHYRSWHVVYDYIRSEKCELPLHLRQMMIDIDENEADIFNRLEKLPVVLCHRDFWVTNIIYSDGKIGLIDWDTAGWGYFGEDMSSLIADENDINKMHENYRRCIPAYYKGFSEYADVSYITDNCVYELILLMFGYRMIESFIFAETIEAKVLMVDTLQKVYELSALPKFSL